MRFSRKNHTTPHHTTPHHTTPHHTTPHDTTQHNTTQHKPTTHTHTNKTNKHTHKHTTQTPNTKQQKGLIQSRDGATPKDRAQRKSGGSHAGSHEEARAAPGQDAARHLAHICLENAWQMNKVCTTFVNELRIILQKRSP